MLSHLFIKNFALIDSVEINAEEGFTVLSGETGAGKSILVEALSLLAGGKADTGLIRTGEKEAIVEGLFDISKNEPLLDLLENLGLAEGNELSIRRHLSTEGKNRIFANGRTVTLSQLTEMGENLLDLSSQHESQTLLKEQNHRRLLDETLNLDEYNKAFEAYSASKKEWGELSQKTNDREREIDWLNFQIKEIEAVNLDSDDEEEKLEAERGRAKNADFLHQLSETAVSTLSDGPSSILEQLDLLTEKLERAAEKDPSLQALCDNLKPVRDPLAEAAHFFSSYTEKLGLEPGRLDEIESRLYAIQQLKRKHGESVALIRAKLDQMKSDLATLSHLDEALEGKKKEVDKLGKLALEQAKTLSQARKKAAKKIENLVGTELGDLSMPNVTFRVAVETSASAAENLTVGGLDAVRFEISANPGEPPRSLSEIASGGELSRILLSIKRGFGINRLPLTYIFDEVDTGIGGGVAEVVGKKLKQIAKTHQVLCITHLPQIASQADHHFVIEKEVSDKRTRTEIRPLENLKAREAEIARMLGGMKITAKTREHAQEMLGKNR